MAIGGARTVVVTLSANVGGYLTGMGAATAASQRAAEAARLNAAAVAQMSAAQRAASVVQGQAAAAGAAAATAAAAQQRAAWATAGAALTGFGLVAVVGLGLAARAAIQWESDWAGVTKTVDGTAAEMQQLEDGLRSLATTLPASHREIAAVAEAAGQLGVARGDVVEFTRTMVALGETTNLSATEAATAIARMANIMGTAPQDVDRLGSSLVALGNAGASTEGEIVTMALRIAGAGRTIGLTEGEVLGFANALSSLGIEAEAGGTAISTVMLKMQQAVDTGGDSLEKIARVAGMTGTEFKAAFETDAAGAIVSFTSGLARADAAGQNTTGIMSDLGFEGIRVTDTLRRLAANSDLLSDSLNLGNSAWSSNSALVEEAAKRYATTASQLQITRNEINDAAISIGDSLLPVINEIAQGASGLASAIGSIPGPVLAAAVPLGALVGVIALAGGALISIVPKVVATRAAFLLLGASMPAVAASLRLLTGALGVVGAVYALGTAFGALANSQREALPGVEQMTSAILGLNDAASTSAINEMFAQISDSVHAFDDLAGAFDRISEKSIGDNIVDFGDKLFGVKGELADAEEAFARVGETLALLTQNGQAELAAEQFAAMAAELGLTGDQTQQLMDLMPAYAEAVASAGNAQALAGESAAGMTTGLAGMAVTADEAKAALDALSEALDRIFTDMFSVEAATDAYQQGLLDLAGQAGATGTSLDGLTAEGLKNRESMRSQIQTGLQLIDNMAQNGASADQLKGKSAELKAEFIRVATQLGFNAGEVNRYASAYDRVPAEVDTIIQADASQALESIASVDRSLSALAGRRVRTTIIQEIIRRGGYSGAGLADGGIVHTKAEAYAHGGIRPQRYAAGGTREHHVAQIASAGAWRVWAEPETGGEAYIPLAPTKRPRSLAITRTVAEAFGYTMVPKQQRIAMATGGIIRAGAPPAAGDPAVGEQHLHFELDGPAAARLAREYVDEALTQTRRTAAVRGRRIR